MTKRDYERIALAISNARWDKERALNQDFQAGIDAVLMWTDILLANNYPNYDPEKFYGKAGGRPRPDQVELLLSVVNK